MNLIQKKTPVSSITNSEKTGVISLAAFVANPIAENNLGFTIH